jgi:hypothetical protein
MNGGFAAQPLWRVTSNWWRVEIGVPELDGIQNSKWLIQNFAARAECAFPSDHFLTESERSGERLL